MINHCSFVLGEWVSFNDSLTIEWRWVLQRIFLRYSLTFYLFYTFLSSLTEPFQQQNDSTKNRSRYFSAIYLISWIYNGIKEYFTLLHWKIRTSNLFAVDIFNMTESLKTSVEYIFSFAKGTGVFIRFISHSMEYRSKISFY